MLLPSGASTLKSPGPGAPPHWVSSVTEPQRSILGDRYGFFFSGCSMDFLRPPGISAPHGPRVGRKAETSCPPAPSIREWQYRT